MARVPHDIYSICLSFYAFTAKLASILGSHLRDRLGRTPKNYPPKGYMDNLPKDPWGAPYVYTCPGEHGDFDLMS